MQPGIEEFHELASYDWSGYVAFPLTSVGGKVAKTLLSRGAIMAPPEFPIIILHLWNSMDKEYDKEVKHFYPTLHLLATFTLRRSIELQAAQLQA